eukprot:GEZU01005314.1.p1 GENE.GEZU01005314.1~~GEZU01005314.1.p1  ORF type:complete len:952 (-),score=400.13 GEZU01005314.1:3202-6057(-)
MSKWFATADSSSEEDSDFDERSESGSESELDEDFKKPTKTATKPAAGASKFTKSFMDDSDDESSEDEKRVVKSAKDKRMDELNKVINDLRNHLKINDWKSVATDFDELNKALANLMKLKEVTAVPKEYIKTLVAVEDAYNELQKDKAAIKKMNQANAKALNSMKQKLKKNNGPYEKQMEEFRKNPEADAEKAAESVESDDDKPAAPAQAPAPAPAKKPAAAPPKKNMFLISGDESSDEESDEFPSDESESESESETESDDDKSKPKFKNWLVKEEPKKPAAPQKKEKKKPAGEKPQKKKEQREVPVQEEKKIVWTDEMIDRKLKEITGARGRKGTNTADLINELSELFRAAKPVPKRIQILMNLVSIQFDVVTTAVAYMDIDLWRSTHKNLTCLFILMALNPQLRVVESDDIVDEIPNKRSEDASEVKVFGSIMAFVERLDNEFLKSLQNIDPHTKDYVTRLSDEGYLIDILEKTYAFYDANKDHNKSTRIAARLLEHVYWRNQHIHDLLQKRHRELSSALATELTKEIANENATAPAFREVITQDIDALVRKFTTLITKNGDDRARTRALLCQIYHHALSGRFYEARDLLLMSRFQDTIQNYDVHTQILFNRTMAQLGLSAFRNGLLKDAHNCLADICSNQRAQERELLAQGVTQRYEKKPEQEKLDRSRLVPYHMHINLDMLEAVHLISAMLFEVPNMAKNPLQSKKNIISKAFRRLLDYYDRQIFTGPPENTKDHINAAARALMKGDWRTCTDMIMKLTIWNYMADRERVQEMIKKQIKEQALRTYLFTYSRNFNAVSLQELTEFFELTPSAAHSIISKMMINEELQSSWDQSTNTIVMYNVEPTKLQQLALYFADKASTLVEYNDKLLELRSGGATKKDQAFDQKLAQQFQKRGDFPQQGGYRQQQGGQQGGQRRQQQQGGRGYTQKGGRGGNRQQDQQQLQEQAVY